VVEFKSETHFRETADRQETFHAARAGSGSMSPDAIGFIPVTARFGKHNSAKMC